MFDNIGYAPDNIIGDGKLHRVKDTHGKLNGAYVLHLDKRQAGYIEDFKQGIKQNWKMTGFIPLSDLQRIEFSIEAHRQAKQRQQAEIAKHKAAATKALYIWNTAPPAPANHPYLIKKHIGIHGARLGRGDTLIIPLTNSKNEIVNLQFISESGGKRFLSGGLNAKYLDEALEISGAKMIDISSGIEKYPGQKSPELIQELMTKVKNVC